MCIKSPVFSNGRQGKGDLYHMEKWSDSIVERGTLKKDEDNSKKKR